ncbi:MAG: cytochrome c oxidase assembly protein [Candidatus Thiodiazotropha sp. (ex Ctena orbiculata)]|nr:cytochrome c oxidase assembly protein [Candidatus Thiodiazotropha taylori]
MNKSGSRENRNRRTTLLLSGLVVGMFGFGFALVPLYDLFCEVTGTQSLSQRKINPADLQVVKQVESDRLVTVKFDATVNPNLPWDFQTTTRSMRVHPGKTYEVNFIARNRSGDAATGQAIPSVAPWQATPYFSKLECFCFNKQTLDGNQQTDMPLRFMVSPDLPADIQSLTLSYSFMRLKASKNKTDLSKLLPQIARQSATENTLPNR